MDKRFTLILVTGAYLAVLGVISVLVRRSSATAQGFVSGDQSFPALLIGFVLLSEFIGTGVSVGTAQLGYSIGISAAWNVIAPAVGFLLFGLFMAEKYKQLGQTTISGVLALQFGGRTRLLSSAVTLYALETVAVAIYTSGGAVLSGVTEIGRGTAIVAVGSSSIAFVIVAGMRSVVYTNVLHAGMKYLGVAIVLAFGLRGVGGIGHLSAMLPARMFAWDFVGWPQIGAWLLAGIGSIFATQQAIQAIHTVGDARAARRAGFYCAVLLVPFGVGTAFIGVLAAAIHPGIDSVRAFPSLIGDMDGLGAGLVVAGLTASLFGTMSAVNLGAATLLMTDFLNPLFNRANDPTRSVVSEDGPWRRRPGMTKVVARP